MYDHVGWLLKRTYRRNQVHSTPVVCTMTRFSSTSCSRTLSTTTFCRLCCWFLNDDWEMLWWHIESSEENERMTPPHFLFFFKPPENVIEIYEWMNDSNEWIKTNQTFYFSSNPKQSRKLFLCISEKKNHIDRTRIRTNFILFFLLQNGKLRFQEELSLLSGILFMDVVLSSSSFLVSESHALDK